MLVLPQDPGQALRLHRSLAAAAFGFLLTVVTGVFLIYGDLRLSATQFVLLNSVFWTVNIVFIAAIWSGYNLQFNDPSLTVPQLLWATLCVLTATHFVEHNRETVLTFYFLALAFGCFRLRFIQFLQMAGAGILGYGVVVFMQYYQQPELRTMPYGLLSWMVFSLVAIAFAAVGSSLSDVRAALSVRNKELATALDELGRASSAKSEFISDLADGLAVPLHTLIESSRTVSASLKDETKRKQVLTLGNVGIHLLAMINCMVDLSKLESKTLTLNSIPYGLVDFVDRIDRMLKLYAEEYDVRFKTSVLEDVPDEVQGDPGRMEEMLISLIGHVIRSNAGGEVRLEVARKLRTEREYLRFVIFDPADSIPNELQELIFSEEFNSHGSEVHKFGGAGVGLAVCRQLMELMGGRIRIQSSRGIGTQISLTIILVRQTMAG